MVQPFARTLTGQLLLLPQEGRLLQHLEVMGEKQFGSLGHPASPDIPTSWSGRPCVPHVYGPDTVIGLNEEAGDYAAFNHVKLTPASVLAMPSIAYRLALHDGAIEDVTAAYDRGQA
ncbi:MAG: hypothetical protein HOL85_21130, partial [Rhodospirillaceae bacterium]|nr:hypothetical protein [Rhodospirillaceae bacterium]